MPETNQLTVDQAFNNVVLVCDAYACNKQQRIALDQSLQLILDAIKPKEVVTTKPH